MAGELVEKGEDVTDFAIGDAVAGMSNRFHGVSTLNLHY